MNKGGQPDATVSIEVDGVAVANRNAVTRSLRDFLGTYQVSRTIEDHRSGQQSTFEGQATLTPDGQGAAYREVGRLVMNDQSFEAERRYTWHEQGGRICVLFEDGTPFHDFDPVRGGQATEHLCGEDMYRGGYAFDEWTCWSLTWDVVGPRKDYRSTTWYVRRAGDPFALAET